MFTREKFQALLDERVLILDGAMGTQLYEQGFKFEGSFDALSLRKPLAVRRVHKDYVAAGAHVLTSNTFGANPIRLVGSGYGDQCEKMNKAAIAIARDAAADRPPYNRPWIAASVGPLGKPLVPVGRISRDQAVAAFQAQLSALVAADPDFIVFETFSDLNELRIASEVLCSLMPDAAFIAFATFTDEGKTLLGHKPEEVVKIMIEAGAAAVGANCSTGPQGLEEVFERMARVRDARLALAPNAGLPSMVDGRYVYVNSPDYFSQWAQRMVGDGVRVIGGCCGTTPEHIARAVEAVGVRAPAPLVESQARSPNVVLREERSDEGKSSVVDAANVQWNDSQFERKLSKGEFVISVELDPPRGVRAKRLVRGAVALKQAGADAINIADSPLATARMSPLALAMLIRQEVDIEILLHVSCRDRNVLGLLSETMGAHALGVRHMLCVTGDPPSVGDYPGSRGVFEVDAIGLLRMLDGLNRGMNVNGKPRRHQTEFRLSCAVNPTAEDLDREVDRFHEKQEAGARYAMTQPLYDPQTLVDFIDRAQPKIPVLVGILPLRNARHAHFIHNEVPGMYVPAQILKRMEQAGEDVIAEGVAIGREFLEAVRPLCAGAYLMPPFNKFEMAVDLIKPDREAD